MAGTLAAGAKIAEQSTAERLGVSRVPVREATIALEHDGLLVHSPTGRLRVPALTERDMAEILEVRQFIEPEVVRLAAERHRPDDIAALERNLAGLRAARDLARVSLWQFLLWIACSQRRLGRTYGWLHRTHVPSGSVMPYLRHRHAADHGHVAGGRRRRVQDHRLVGRPRHSRLHRAAATAAP